MYTLRDALIARAREMHRNVRVWCCGSYQRSKTFDGIDVCADRVIHEIIEKIEETRRSGVCVQKFSIIGQAWSFQASQRRELMDPVDRYSLGGLIARVVVKHLVSTKGSIFDNVELCNFATFASPAIGMPT
jgi:hypothetical protein